MKILKYITVILTAVLLSVSAYSATGLDKFKEEQKKEEVKCYVTESQERSIYRHMKDKMVDFNSVEILAWGHPIGGFLGLAVPKNSISVRLKVRANTSGGKDVRVLWYILKPDDTVHTFIDCSGDTPLESKKP